MLVARTDASITANVGAQYVVDEQWLTRLVPILKQAGFNRIGDLDMKLSEAEKVLLVMEKDFFVPRQLVGKIIQAGTCLVHLAFIEVARNRGVDGLRDYIDVSGIAGEKPNKDLAKDIFNAYEQARK